mmetsp:Transcript_28971/g.59769  ORF Transcript_28971/g.59769 Transcript_28971/m.59769 type:complete len:274 (+) Transcript_28971:1398-2219(+)
MQGSSQHVLHKVAAVCLGRAIEYSTLLQALHDTSSIGRFQAWRTALATDKGGKAAFQAGVELRPRAAFVWLRDPFQPVSVTADVNQLAASSLIRTELQDCVQVRGTPSSNCIDDLLLQDDTETLHLLVAACIGFLQHVDEMFAVQILSGVLLQMRFQFFKRLEILRIHHGGHQNDEVLAMQALDLFLVQILFEPLAAVQQFQKRIQLLHAPCLTESCYEAHQCLALQRALRVCMKSFSCLCDLLVDCLVGLLDVAACDLTQMRHVPASLFAHV